MHALNQQEALAQVNYEYALTLNPNYNQANSLLSSLINNQVAEYQSSFDPESVEDKLQEFKQQNQADNAYDLLKEALIYDPTNPQWRIALAELFAQSGYRIQAEQELLQALAYNPQNDQVKSALNTLLQ